jgi:hypothetical protein
MTTGIYLVIALLVAICAGAIALLSVDRNLVDTDADAARDALLLLADLAAAPELFN